MQEMVRVGSDKVWAEDSGGAGPVLVLLHEGVADSRMWDPVWPALTASYRVIRYDVRGYGKSGPATQDYTLAGDLRAVLAHFGIPRAHLAGCSMGGLCAVEFALAEPDRVQSLVLLASGFEGYRYPEQPELEAEYAALDAAGDEDGIVRLLLGIWGAAGPDAFVTDLMRSSRRAAANEEQFQHPGEGTYDRLEQLRPPTVIMVGDKDFPPLIAANEEAARRIPRCELIRMPGVDHYPTVRAPALVLSTILRHCAAA
ncbi:MAG TPA: alpha/beta hydrolase [Streptosporangiaceae bacterium]|nr:alpha/beta hydrolase [Streptosporangiaceae bacterium]